MKWDAYAKAFCGWTGVCGMTVVIVCEAASRLTEIGLLCAPQALYSTGAEHGVCVGIYGVRSHLDGNGVKLEVARMAGGLDQSERAQLKSIQCAHARLEFRTPAIDCH